MGRERSPGTPRSGNAGLGVADTLSGRACHPDGWMTGLPSGLHSFDPATLARQCNAGNRAGHTDVPRFSIGTVSAVRPDRDPLAGYVTMARGRRAGSVDMSAAGNDQVARHRRACACTWMQWCPWQSMDTLELLLAYPRLKRSDVTAALFPLTEGDLLRVQLQINCRALQPDERQRALACTGSKLVHLRCRSPAATAGWSAHRHRASAIDPHKYPRASPPPVLHE